MGIKYLNRFLKNQANKGIRQISFSSLENKTIVIDTSIYIYKFSNQFTSLEQGFTSMVSVFQKYNITPIFVFDGKPPDEKKNLLIQRKMQKQIYKEQYEHEIANNNVTEEIEKLKLQFQEITMNDIIQTQNILRNLHVRYTVSPVEADPLCVLFVNSGKAWACLTDDMDMFAYGCSRVLRDFNSETETATIYVTKDILNQLGFSFDEFQKILVLSGTDYNVQSVNDRYNRINIYQSLKLYATYLSKKRTNQYFTSWNTTTGKNVNLNTNWRVPQPEENSINNNSFFTWVHNNYPQYVPNIFEIEQCIKMFRLEHYSIQLQPFLTF